MDKYLVNYKDGGASTAIQHMQVCAENGKVAWMQWASENSKSVMSQRSIDNMNQHGAFELYALDRHASLLQMQVEKVISKEEALDCHLDLPFPQYYDINTKGYGIYIINHINTMPPEAANNFVTSSGKNVFTTAKNINGSSPWRIYETSEFDKYVPQKTIEFSNKVSATPILVPTLENHYSVYCFTYIGSCEEFKGRKYIGMTGNINERYAHHANPANWVGREQTKFLYQMFRIVGFNNFSFEVLYDNLTREEAMYYEAKTIADNQASIYGFNERNEKKALNIKI